MKAETVKTLKRNESGGFNIIFMLASEGRINRPSKVSSVAWALVENETDVIVVKEAPSTTNHYARQDIGFELHSPKFSQHYDVSIRQYNAIFGERNWRKIWLTFEEFQNWKGERNLIMDIDADSLQNESWNSTGNR